MFGLWTLIVLLNMLAGHGYAGQMHSMVTITLGMVLVVELVFAVQARQVQERVILVLLVLLGLEALRSLPTLWSEPLLPRSMMGLAR